MEIETPVLRNQTSEDIYKEALELARIYCPELDISKDNSNYFDQNDPVLIIFKVFSKMTEFLLVQANKIPDKYRLAFLDFIGLELLPSSPAKVPLTFSLSEGSSDAYVPAGTAVASSKDPSVVFETSQDLSVVASGLNSVFSLNPWEDKYTYHEEALSGKENGFYIFGCDISEKKLDHVLYLGDDTLLDLRREAKVMISFNGKNLSKKYFDCWVDGNSNPLKINNEIPIDPSTEISVSLSIPKMDKTSVNGVNSFWIAVKPEENEQIVNKLALPEISTIAASVSVNGIILDLAFFNNVPLDSKKGFYPFGEGPNKIGDTFYVGSEEAFSKEGAEISLDVTAVKKDVIKSAILLWEYWNGSKWNKLEIQANPEKDSVKSFQEPGSIKFICPFIPIAEINGQLNRWIQVRLKSGNYGTAGGIEQNDTGAIVEKLGNAIDVENRDKFKRQLTDALSASQIAFGFEYKKEDLNPPFIESINISYNYNNVALKRKKRFNSFKFEDFTAGDPYIPSEGMPALYLGFKENIADTFLNLFFAVKEQFYNEKQENICLKDEDCTSANQSSVISLAWEFFGSDGTWREFGVEDNETRSLRTGGIVSFLVPSEIQKSFNFGKELYWIRARVKSSEKVACPKLKGIFPNTVWALNCFTIENEILGSGNGEPNLSLSFSKKPILEGEIIEIKEPSIPSSDELRSFEAEGKDVLRIKEETGEIKEIWVVWNRTTDFALSNSLSRHYMLDRANGIIIFGDGTHGMIPTRGKNNIVARKYRSGGGKEGDVASGILTSLKTTIPNIENVTNNVSSSGGTDQESLESVINRGPYTLKNGGRAVTREDFEWLSYEASQYVAKAKCITENGNVNIIIVPRYEGDIPLPEAGLLDLIKNYLKERALVTVSDIISVLGPEYETIDVEVKFKLAPLAQSKIVTDKVKERVKQFLHPLKGGQNGEGWDFGQAIFISEIAAVVEDILGVDYVTFISLTKEDKKVSQSTKITVCGVKSMEIKPNSLPSAGIIDVKPGE